MLFAMTTPICGVIYSSSIHLNMNMWHKLLTFSRVLCQKVIFEPFRFPQKCPTMNKSLPRRQNPLARVAFRSSFPLKNSCLRVHNRCQFFYERTSSHYPAITFSITFHPLILNSQERYDRLLHSTVMPNSEKCSMYNVQEPSNNRRF